ncbi:MAG TPA: large conductance mechanosensitive channel protein MscL [Clostridiales bacterium]|nr:large conductance mechanosensitive channel protein MscL [Clostridiales bacterium]
MAKEFKKFIMRGNVMDLAIGIIIGGAFGKIVTSLVNDIIMPLIGLILGKVNFADMKYVITPATDTAAEVAFKYGAFIQSIIDFLIIALCIFLIVKLLTSFKKKQEEPAVPPLSPPTPPKNELLLEEIRDLLKSMNEK